LASKTQTILKRFPSPNRRRVGPDGLETRLRGAFWRALIFGEMVVISRALLHFERLERPPGPIDARMRAAISLTARARAPFEYPGLHVVWQARHAAVWSWDLARVTGLGTPEGAWFMPEPALSDDRAPADTTAEDGFTLIERRDGYEGQIWRNGELTASRFWLRRPGADEIERFRRAVHGAPDAQDGVDGDKQEADAAAFSARIRDVGARFKPVHAAALAVLLIGAPMMHAAGSQARLTLEQGSAQRALAAFAESSAGDFGALERYRAHSAQLGVYRQALERINPLAPAADLAEVAGALGARITMLRIEPGRARARIEAGGELDPAALAQALESRPSLANVRLNRTANSAAWEAEADITEPDGETES